MTYDAMLYHKHTVLLLLQYNHSDKNELSLQKKCTQNFEKAPSCKKPHKQSKQSVRKWNIPTGFLWFASVVPRKCQDNKTVKSGNGHCLLCCCKALMALPFDVTWDETITVLIRVHKDFRTWGQCRLEWSQSETATASLHKPQIT
jgi:hypothetical protein